MIEDEENKFQNAVIFKPSNPENVANFSIRRMENQCNIMKSDSLETNNNNNIESVIEGMKNMGNISKILCSKQSEKMEESKKLDNGVNENKKGTNEFAYDSEEFDEYKDEEDLSKNLEAILTTPAKTFKTPKSKQSSIQQPRSATSVAASSRTKSRMSVASTSSVVNRHPRINMSFTNDKAKEIERENDILLKKILKAKCDKTTTSQPPMRLKSSNSSLARKRMQERIQHDNLIILKKIQKVKSSNLSLR